MDPGTIILVAAVAFAAAMGGAVTGARAAIALYARPIKVDVSVQTVAARPAFGPIRLRHN